MLTGASLVRDEKTGFLTPGSNYALTGFTAEKKQKLIEYLYQDYNISRACEAVGISPRAFYENREFDEVFKEKVKEALNGHLDSLESNMLRLGKTAQGITAGIFMLKSHRREIYGDRLNVWQEKPQLLDAITGRVQKTMVLDAELVEEKQLQTSNVTFEPPVVSTETNGTHE